MRKLWVRIWTAWRAWEKCQIMIVKYDVNTNYIECVDWVSNKIPPFSGQLTPELWKEIKPYCRLGFFPHTVIYIWAGFEKKHLAYWEPVEDYLDNYDLLQTGQGYDFESGLRYGESRDSICPHCKRKYD